MRVREGGGSGGIYGKCIAAREETKWWSSSTGQAASQQNVLGWDTSSGMFLNVHPVDISYSS